MAGEADRPKVGFNAGRGVGAFVGGTLLLTPPPAPLLL
jgi:hypothetical protein